MNATPSATLVNRDDLADFPASGTIPVSSYCWNILVKKTPELKHVLRRIFEFMLSIPQDDAIFRDLIILATPFKSINIGSIGKTFLEASVKWTVLGQENTFANKLFTIWERMISCSGLPESLTSFKTIWWLALALFQKLRGLVNNMGGRVLSKRCFFVYAHVLFYTDSSNHST